MTMAEATKGQEWTNCASENCHAGIYLTEVVHQTYQGLDPDLAIFFFPTASDARRSGAIFISKSLSFASTLDVNQPTHHLEDDSWSGVER